MIKLSQLHKTSLSPPSQTKFKFKPLNLNTCGLVWKITTIQRNETRTITLVLKSTIREKEFETVSLFTLIWRFNDIPCNNQQW